MNANANLVTSQASWDCPDEMPEATTSNIEYVAGLMLDGETVCDLSWESVMQSIADGDTAGFDLLLRQLAAGNPHAAPALHRLLNEQVTKAAESVAPAFARERRSLQRETYLTHQREQDREYHL